MKASVTSTETKEGQVDRRLLGPDARSIGVVFGDIGTSPLYAFREAVRGAAQASR